MSTLPLGASRAEVVDDDRELPRARAGEERAEALAVGERELGARAAVEVHAVHEALVGQVVVRQQAQVARAARRREQDRRLHAGLADRLHEPALLGAPRRPRDAAVAVGRRAVARGVEGGLQPDAAILVELRGEVAHERERLRLAAAVHREDDDEVRRARVGDGVADRGQPLVGIRDGGDVEAHRVDAHRPERPGVVPHLGERLGVERPGRVGQRVGRDHGAAHDEAVAGRIEDVGAAHGEGTVRARRRRPGVGCRRQHCEGRDCEGGELLLHTSHVSHRPGEIPREPGGIPLRCLRAHRFPRPQRHGDHRGPRTGRSPRRPLARVQLPGRGRRRLPSSRPRASTRRPSRAARSTRAVRAALADGKPLYAVDAELLERLAPDLIVTQDLCEVCAVPSGDVRRLTQVTAETLSLDPRDLAGIEESIRTLARHLGVAARGEELAQAMHHRIDGVHQAVRGTRAAARVRRRVARSSLRRRALGARDGRARRRRRGARAHARALLPHDVGRRRRGGAAADRARTVRLRRRAHRRRVVRRAGARRARRRRRRRRRVLAARPARGRGRRAARAPHAPGRRRGACAAVRPLRPS